MRGLAIIVTLSVPLLLSSIFCEAKSFDFQIKTTRLAATGGNAVIADFNQDGWSEPLGSLNLGAGVLSTSPLEDLGVAIVSDEAAIGDVRAADFNGDSYPDLIVEPYANGSADEQARLYINDGTGHFNEDLRFKAREYRGRGEGLVVADFNNDGMTDIYLPFYTFSCAKISWVDIDCPNAPQSYLLLNDGQGNFTEVADRAGVAQRPTDSDYLYGLHPEGGQAADINDDGLIDILISSKIFLNQGYQGSVTTGTGMPLQVPRFVYCPCGIPQLAFEEARADEGAKFLDWNNDGRLDMVSHHWDRGPRLFENKGSFPLLGAGRRSLGVDPGALNLRFVKRPYASNSSAAIPVFSDTSQHRVTFLNSFGLNVYDLDNDGLEDIVVPASEDAPAKPCRPTATTVCPQSTNVLFRNTGDGFVLWRDSALVQKNATGHTAFGDFNRDGRMDVMDTSNNRYYLNRGGSKRAFAVEVLGPNGEQNQFGRVVRALLPKPGCSLRSKGCTLTRVVDGGSGFHSQSQYLLLIGTALTGKHTVSVLLPYENRLVEIRAKVQPQQKATIYAPSSAYPVGRVVISGDLGR